DSAFGALADPTRRAILAQLAGGERSIKELAGNFAMSLPAVSKHIRVLERAGLARIRQQGRVRRCQLVATPLRAAAGWIATYRRFWEASFDRLADYLDATLTEEDPSWPTSRPRPRKTPPPSKSAAPSRPRGNASSTRGRRPKR